MMETLHALPNEFVVLTFVYIPFKFLAVASVSSLLSVSVAHDFLQNLNAMSQRPSTESSGSAGGLNPPAASGPDRTPSPAPSTASKTRGEDYVYFERSTEGFSSDAVSRATAAKLKLESYYKLAVDVAIERNGRYVSGWSDHPNGFCRLTTRFFSQAHRVGAKD